MSAPSDRSSSIPTSAGPCRIPLIHDDGSVVGLVYRLAPDAVSALLPEGPIEPYVAFGRATILLAAFDYRSSSIGPYRQVALTILAKRRGSAPTLFGSFRDLETDPDLGLFVIELPVSSPLAFAAAGEIWGYPVYETKIATEFRPDGLVVDVLGDVTLRMGLGGGLSTSALPLVTFSSVNDALVRTVITGAYQVCWGGTRTVELEIAGDGPLGEALLRLGIDGVKPAMAFRSDAVESSFPQGVVVGAG